MAAQTPDEIPPPKAPFVVPVPDMAQWTISVSYSASAGPAGADSSGKSEPKMPGNTVKQIATTKTGSTKHDVILHSDGTAEDVWYVGRNLLTSAGNGTVGVSDGSELNADFTMAPILRERGNLTRSFGFPGLDWLKLKYYVGVAKDEGGAASYHYILKNSDGIAAEAWIDVKTNYPIKYTGDGATYMFTFGSPPTDALVLPPAYAKAYAQLQAQQNYMNALERDAAKVEH